MVLNCNAKKMFLLHMPFSKDEKIKTLNYAEERDNDKAQLVRYKVE